MILALAASTPARAIDMLAFWDVLTAYKTLILLLAASTPAKAIAVFVLVAISPAVTMFAWS